MVCHRANQYVGMVCHGAMFVVRAREPSRHLQGDIMYKCLESRTSKVSLSRLHYFYHIPTHLTKLLAIFSPFKYFEQENVYRSYSPRAARAQQVILHPCHFIPGQQLKLSQRQYSAKFSPLPLLSEISASGLTAPHIVIRTAYQITHKPGRPANLSLASHLCRPTLHPRTVLGARADWYFMNTVVAFPL